MNKENWYRIIIILSFLILTLLSITLFLSFGIIGLIFFSLVVFFIIVLGFIELYLRVQHNIDRKYRNLKREMKNEQERISEKIAGTSKEIIELKNEQKKNNKDIIDFFESLISYLEDFKKDFDDLKNKINESLKKEIAERLRKMAGGFEDMINSQFEQVEKLKEEITRLIKKDKRKNNY